jgi:uncharacterized protein YbjT (DUF2867 family)
MLDHEKLTVLVTGATGMQGGTLARVLLDRGHHVRAFTRKPDSPAAVRLAESGAEIFEGSFDNGASIEKAARGTDAVFAMGTPYQVGTEVETRQAKLIVDASAAAGTEHLVYSSVAGADKNTGIPHFDSKHEVEKHIRFLNLPHTIVGPVYVMENLFYPMHLDTLKQGTYALPLPADRVLQQIALEDIGRFAAHVIENREKFLGKRIDIASDEIDGGQTARLLSSLNGHDINYFEISIDDIRKQIEDIAVMYEWFDKVGFGADIKGLRRDYPDIGWHSFKDWAGKQDWSVLGE